MGFLVAIAFAALLTFLIYYFAIYRQQDELTRRDREINAEKGRISQLSNRSDRPYDAPSSP